MKSVISDIRKKQDELIMMINGTFDSIIKEIQNIDFSTVDEKNEFELIFPITNTTGFKGKKVIAVILNGERVITPTWRKVVEFILKDAISDKSKLNKLNNLRDRLLGRVRTRVSSKKDEMRSPLKLKEDLFVEVHYDTETLMNFLLQILDEIGYDYGAINIVIKC